MSPSISSSANHSRMHVYHSQVRILGLFGSSEKKNASWLRGLVKGGVFDNILG